MVSTFMVSLTPLWFPMTSPPIVARGLYQVSAKRWEVQGDPFTRDDMVGGMQIDSAVQCHDDLLSFS